MNVASRQTTRSRCARMSAPQGTSRRGRAEIAVGGCVCTTPPGVTTHLRPDRRQWCPTRLSLWAVAWFKGDKDQEVGDPALTNGLPLLGGAAAGLEMNPG